MTDASRIYMATQRVMEMFWRQTWDYSDAPKFFWSENDRYSMFVMVRNALHQKLLEGFAKDEHR